MKKIILLLILSLACLLGVTACDKTEEPTESYEEYTVGKWYYNGNKVSFDGKNYNCIAPEGVVCVWSPTEYPAYWEEIA